MHREVVVQLDVLLVRVLGEGEMRSVLDGGRLPVGRVGDWGQGMHRDGDDDERPIVRGFVDDRDSVDPHDEVV